MYFAALACLLVASQVIVEKCPSDVESKCGGLYRDGYVQIIVSVSSALQLVFLAIYSSK